MTNDDEPILARPTRLPLTKGSWVRHEKTLYLITAIADLESVIAESMEDGRQKQIRIEELEPLPLSEKMIERMPLPLHDFTKEEEEIAKERLEKIQPLLNMEFPRRADFETCARGAGCHYTTLYRWYRYYTAWKDVTVLVPRKRGWKKGNYRIAKEAEAIVTDVIDNYYLRPRRRGTQEPEERPTIEQTITEIAIRCDEHDIDPPSDSTIRQRISRIAPKDRMQGRGETKRARDKFRPVPGHFPNADCPLAVVQIDHTKVDIALVDDEHRQSIGRVWLTLAIDVYSRMVTGYHLSLDPPSTTSVAMCLSHAFLPKERWLSEKGVEATWPVWGFPATIHADNAREFHAETLKLACLKYNINLEFRPVRQPQYGGHIERLLGTLGQEIHALPGTTSSSVKEKGEYDSDKNATFSTTEFELVLLELIANVYHRREHKGIDEITPLKKWEIGILGDREANVTGIGFPDKPGNPAEVEKDFLPMFERTVQRTGVSIDGLRYYDSVLDRWIGQPDPKDPKRKAKFTFRRDPRDITVIWIWEPRVGRYFDVPVAGRSLSPMSIWEFEEAKRLAKEAGHDPHSQEEILRARKKIREKIRSAKASTKKARRDAQRQRQNQKKDSPAIVVSSTDVADVTPSDDLTDEPLEGFAVFR